MQRGTTVADPELPVKLKDEELLDRGQHLAEMIAQRVALKAAKDKENKHRQGEIDELDDEIGRLARVIREGHENRNQMDLFSDQLSPDESKRRLAAVAAHAAKHPFTRLVDGDPNVCGRDGCVELATADVHVPPLPSQPHTFAGDGSGEDKCWACGSGKDDPVHAESAPAAAPIDPAAQHPYLEREDVEACVHCGRELDDDVHGELLATLGPDTNLGLHDFKSTPESGDDCVICAFEEAAAIHRRHDFVPIPEADLAGAEPSLQCFHCDLDQSNPIHAAQTSAQHAEAAELVDQDTTPGDTPAAESVAIAREHVTGDGSGEALPEVDPANPERVADPAFDFPADEEAPKIDTSVTVPRP